MRGRYRILLGMAAGVGKTYRMLQEGRQAQAEGRDVVIGYLEPHDRPETAALAEGLEVVPRLRAQHGALELEEMDVDAVIRRAPELALVDELAHTNAPGTRNEKRYQDIDEMLDAGIDVISTVNVQHLESLNDAIFELTERARPRDVPRPDPRRGRRGRARRPHARGAAGAAARGQGLSAGAGRRSALDNFFRRRQPRGAARARAARGRRGRRGAAARRASLDPLSQQAVAERVLALVEPQPKSQRILRRAWRSAQRLGAEIDALWVRKPGAAADRGGAGRSSRALRRLAVVLGAHFLEEEGDDLVATVRAGRRTSAARPTSSSARPTSRRRREILRGSLLSRSCASCPGVDIRVVAEPRRPRES